MNICRIKSAFRMVRVWVLGWKRLGSARPEEVPSTLRFKERPSEEGSGLPQPLAEAAAVE